MEGALSFDPFLFHDRYHLYSVFDVAQRVAQEEGFDERAPVIAEERQRRVGACCDWPREPDGHGGPRRCAAGTRRRGVEHVALASTARATVSASTPGSPSARLQAGSRGEDRRVMAVTPPWCGRGPLSTTTARTRPDCLGVEPPVGAERLHRPPRSRCRSPSRQSQVSSPARSSGDGHRQDEDRRRPPPRCARPRRA